MLCYEGPKIVDHGDWSFEARSRGTCFGRERGNTRKLETPDLWNPGATTQSSECFQWEFFTEFGFAVKAHLDKAWMKSMYIHIRTWKHQDKVDQNICVVESLVFKVARFLG